MTADSSPPDVGASVSQVPERAASDHDCTRCSRCTDFAAAQDLLDLPKKRYLGKVLKTLRNI